MPLIDPAIWTDRLEQTLQCYDESLLRQIAGHFIKPRNQWPVKELIERCLATVNNVAVIDRRLKELDPAERRLLALIGHSGQPRWRVVNLIEMLATLGEDDGLKPVRRLLEAGLLYAELLALPSSPVPGKAGPTGLKRIRTFDHWLGQGGATGLWVFAHPHITQRALGEDLGLPPCPEASTHEEMVQEADGLEWLLRLAVLWQQVRAEPLRRTQQGEFFKRDLERLQGDPLLKCPPADALAELPEAGLLAAALGVALGVLQENNGQLEAEEIPACWDQGLLPALASVWAAFPLLDTWPVGMNKLEGDGRLVPPSGNPYVSAFVIALLLLAKLPKDGWAKPAEVEKWVLDHHPYWGPSSRIHRAGSPISRQRSPLAAFLLGFAYQLKVLQATRDKHGEWVIRLSSVGRWFLGIGEKPAKNAPVGPSLVVQPNLEIVAYRQGLTPSLIGRLSRFAAWKSLGAACLLQLQPEGIYRALETGQTLESIIRTLEQHGLKPTPPPVLDLLRTWTSKRDRLSIYPSATLLEFANPEDLNESLARGLPGVRLGDRLAVVADENDIDFRNFRLTGSRDYGLPPDKCVDIENDGISLTIDPSRSDLLVETELRRFAQSLDQPTINGRRLYRLTAGSLAAAQDSGLGLRNMEEWFLQRTGQPMSAAARLLLTGPVELPLELRQRLVLQVGSPEVADGLMQLPETSSLIQARLGPTALAIAEEHLDELRRRLKELGLSFQN
jgi:hypothetical protein